jgi:hypothetical protein
VPRSQATGRIRCSRWDLDGCPRPLATWGKPGFDSLAGWRGGRVQTVVDSLISQLVQQPLLSFPASPATAASETLVILLRRTPPAPITEQLHRQCRCAQRPVLMTAVASPTDFWPMCGGLFSSEIAFASRQNAWRDIPCSRAQGPVLDPVRSRCHRTGLRRRNEKLTISPAKEDPPKKQIKVALSGRYLSTPAWGMKSIYCLLLST